MLTKDAKINKRWVFVAHQKKKLKLQKLHKTMSTKQTCMSPVQRHVSITSSFLMEVKKECHTCKDGFTVHNLLP
jgi:hypothetical protein